MVQLPTGPTLSCPFGASPIAVIATYAGGLVPVEGATVTLFYSTLASLIGAPMTTTRTNAVGLGEACFTTGYYVQARIQKTGVDFGSGNGVQHIIGTKSGWDRFLNQTFLIIALTPPPLPPIPTLPCQGSISIPQPNFTQLLSGPSLPGSIPVPVSITGTGLPQSIPLIIYLDDRVVSRPTMYGSSINLDLKSIIPYTGLSSSHRLSIKVDLPKCNIPAAGLDIPALIPAALPCSGLLSILQPNFLSLLSGPSLPGSIPVPVSITGTGLPSSIPLSILVDGMEVTTATGVRNGSVNIDVLSVIRSSLGAAALNTGHTITIRPNLPDCNIPAASLSVPALIPAAITQPCTEGETKMFRCPNGTEIVIARCKRDPTTGINVFVPTGDQCEIPKMFSELGKTVKILTYPAGAALEAFDGMDVTITASVVCGASPSSGETAIFLVDGNEISRGTTSGGFVSFTWKATVDPSRTHKLCVSVPKSSQCSEFGEARDCKTITVSRSVPDVMEKLKKERESYIGQLEAQRIEREKIREISLTLPQQPYVPTVPTVPTVPEVPIVSTPVLPPVEKVPGIIDIPVVTAPPGVPYPIEIRIDGNIIGPPPVYKEVTPGTHTVTISLKGFTPISKKVSLTAGQILTISEGFL